MSKIDSCQEVSHMSALYQNYMNLTANQHSLYMKLLPYYSPFVFLLFKMWIRKKEEHLF